MSSNTKCQKSPLVFGAWNVYTMKVFITRNLTSDSPLKKQLAAHPISLTGISLIAFQPYHFQPLPVVDWLFFYSKNGVKYFFEQCSNAIPRNVQIATMGASTAKAVARYGYTVDFVGKGTPDAISFDFQKVANGQRVAFLRAKNSRRTIQKSLKNKLSIVDRIVYENRPIRPCCLPFFDILIFTSPLNAITYFQDNEYQPPQAIISIGPTTTQALNTLGLVNINTAPASSEEALASCVLHYICKE